MFNNIKIERLRNPIGVDFQHPEISWVCDGGREQTAYRVCATVDGATVWDSGVVTTKSMRATYAPELHSRERVELSVTLYDENGVALCAIDKAYREGKCSFQKPISCHLYPIRVLKFKNGGEGLNYHRWYICKSACENGCKLGIPVYKGLREPIIRKWGEEFYKALEIAEELLKQN